MRQRAICFFLAIYNAGPNNIRALHDIISSGKRWQSKRNGKYDKLSRSEISE
jgi:hypothetical protein